MTRKTRMLISLVLAAAAFAAGIAVYAQSSRDRNAQADGSGTTRYTVDGDGRIAPPPSDQRKAKGTDENPFFVLEIVPYEGMGTFGYHIAGCEPIDMQAAAYAGATIPAEAHLYESPAATSVKRVWTSEEVPAYFPTTQTETHQTQYGTMKYVGDGTGNYNRKADPAPTYSYTLAPADYTGTRYVQNADSTYTEDAAGIYMRHTVSAQYEATENGTGGEYLWTPLPADTCAAMTAVEQNEYRNSYHDPDGNGEFKTYFTNVPCYVAYNVKSYVHKNIFLKESIGLAYEMKDGRRVAYTEGAGKPTLEERIANYKCVVYTVTPEDLNVTKNGVLLNKALIERADLISFSSVDSTGAAVSAYHTYQKYDSSGLKCELNRSKAGITFNDNPLDWPAALAIYERATDMENPLPLIWDTHTYTDFTATFREVTLKCTTPNGNVNRTVNGSQNNLFKLYLMLYEMASPVFESFFGDPATFPTASYTQNFTLGDGRTKTVTFTTPLLTDYEGDGQRYWANQTLYPWKSGILPDTSSLDAGSNMAVLDSLGIMNNGGGSLFHYNSGGAQNLVRNGIHIYDGSTFLTTGFEDYSLVRNDQYGREVYEYFESIGLTKSRVTTAELLFYLLNGLEDSPSAVNNHNYKVLELQPATQFKNSTAPGTVTNDPYWNAFIAQYANTTGTVTADRMSTSEFIGKRVECSDYDLIYIGVDMLDYNWALDYSSTGTDFIYAHTGPKIYLNKPAMLGWFEIPSPVPNPSPESYYVLSGNDLTEAALDKLVRYADSGAPILFGTGFFTDENAAAMVNAIDRNSNVFDLVKNHISTPIYEYALTKQSTRMAAENALRDGLAKSRRVELTNVTLPRPYNGVMEDDDNYLPGGTLTFRFTVNAPAGSEYQVVLYVDTNGDGVFTADEIMGGVTTRLDGSGGGTGGKVAAGKTYVVQKPVDDRVGAVAWKLDLVNLDSYYTNKGLAVPEIKQRTVHASLSGLSAIKANKKEDLRILQIVMPHDSANKLKLPMDGESGLTAVQQKFWDGTRNLNGLDLSFIRMKEEEVVAMLAANPRYLEDNYEMLILGFGDMYDGVKETEVINAIANFAAAGKAVLYTHDTSSMIGSSSGETWGKDMTKAFRDRFGMDRYDVSLYRGDTSLPTGAVRADYPYVTTKYESAIGDLAMQSTYALTQGWTNGHIFRYKKYSGGNVLSKRVTKVNSGAITQYPYLIPDTITVAETHPQYYQLDMEQEEMMVWYCLADTPSASAAIREYYQASANDVRNNYYIYNCGNITYSGMGHSDDMSDEEIKLFINTFVAAYRATAKPVQIAVANDDAAKASSGEYYVCVDIDSSDSDALLGGAELGAYDSYRLQEADGTNGYKECAAAQTGVSKRIYFYITNSSSITTPTYALKFYMENETTGAMTKEVPFAVYRKSDNVFMSTKTNGTSFLGSDATDETIYYVDVPLKTETVDGKTAITSTQLNIEVMMTYYQGTQEFSVPGTTTVQIVPRGLFDLD